MRKEYDSSKGTRWSSFVARRSGKPDSAGTAGAVAGPTGDPPLTSSSKREIRRRMADLDDPVRYVLASRMSPRFILFCDASDGTYVLNNPQGATLFKRRDAAESVKRVAPALHREAAVVSERLY